MACNLLPYILGILTRADGQRKHGHVGVCVYVSVCLCVQAHMHAQAVQAGMCVRSGAFVKVQPRMC